jgi:hypothetical protein
LNCAAEIGTIFDTCVENEKLAQNGKFCPEAHQNHVVLTQIVISQHRLKQKAWPPNTSKSSAHAPKRTTCKTETEVIQKEVAKHLLNQTCM